MQRFLQITSLSFRLHLLLSLSLVASATMAADNFLTLSVNGVDEALKLGLDPLEAGFERRVGRARWSFARQTQRGQQHQQQCRRHAPEAGG